MNNENNSLVKAKVDHHLNAIKMSILRGTSLTGIEMMVKDEETLTRLKTHIIPVSTLIKLKKGVMAEANTKYLELVEWVSKAKERIGNLNGLLEHDRFVLYDELDLVLAEVVRGDITTNPHATLMAYLQTGNTYAGSYLSDEGREVIASAGGLDREELIGICTAGEKFLESTLQLGENVGRDGILEAKIPFPITYWAFADITEVTLLQNTDKAPATANSLRSKLGAHFSARIDKGLLSDRDMLSLYRAIGPERIQPKAAVEVNHNTVNDNRQQMVIVKSTDKLKPNNLVVNGNNELLGVGESYGNIGKSALLKLAAGELDTNTNTNKISMGKQALLKEAITISP